MSEPGGFLAQYGLTVTVGLEVNADKADEESDSKEENE